MSVNRVMLIGRLGKDPETKQLEGGRTRTLLRLATNEVWNDKEGKRQERTEWHDIVAWGSLAERAGQFLAKGRQVYVEGKMQTRKWTNKEGQERYSVEVVANNIQFLSDGRDHSGSGFADRQDDSIPAAPEAPF